MTGEAGARVLFGCRRTGAALIPGRAFPSRRRNALQA